MLQDAPRTVEVTRGTVATPLDAPTLAADPRWIAEEVAVRVSVATRAPCLLDATPVPSPAGLVIYAATPLVALPEVGGEEATAQPAVTGPATSTA